VGFKAFINVKRDMLKRDVMSQMTCINIGLSTLSNVGPRCYEIVKLSDDEIETVMGCVLLSNERECFTISSHIVNCPF
jgi:hypothetical protein